VAAYKEETHGFGTFVTFGTTSLLGSWGLRYQVLRKVEYDAVEHWQLQLPDQDRCHTFQEKDVRP